jgi:hypothetical protein
VAKAKRTASAPKPSSAGYSGTPLVKKLGIKPATTLALLSAPAGFLDLIGDRPADVRITARQADDPALTIWFVTSRRDLDGRMPLVARAMGQGLWVAWPKKASGVATDLNEDLIRAVGIAQGLVDYKVCAIDATWSGLKFARRQAR